MKIGKEMPPKNWPKNNSATWKPLEKNWSLLILEQEYISYHAWDWYIFQILPVCLYKPPHCWSFPVFHNCHNLIFVAWTLRAGYHLPKVIKDILNHHGPAEVGPLVAANLQDYIISNHMFDKLVISLFLIYFHSYPTVHFLSCQECFPILSAGSWGSLRPRASCTRA